MAPRLSLSTEPPHPHGGLKSPGEKILWGENSLGILLKSEIPWISYLC